MKICTLVFGCLLIITSIVTVTNGFTESLDFSALVNMNWTTSTAFHKNPIAPYIETLYHQTKVYAIVFDAGSTGTRIHVYKFRYSQNETYPYVLVDELFEEVKPGVSSYANKPADVKKGIIQLLQSAKRKIPKPFWVRTWMTLKATAGLRLLGEQQAQTLLDEVKSVLNTSGFQLMPNGVSIMSGLDEGILSWVTVNFLLQRVRQPRHSFGTIDLGGGSMQITFVPDHNVSRRFLQKVKLGNSKKGIYSHSYLGLGLMSARYCILIGCNNTNDKHSGDTIVSECVPGGYSGHWTFGGVRYLINSTSNVMLAKIPTDQSMFDRCYARSRKLVTQILPVDHPDELPNQQFYVFSYFYDRVKDAAGLDDMAVQQHISPEQYRVLANKACLSAATGTMRKPFLCLDLTYIYALLKDGFRFHDSNALYLTKKINNIELGWALGAVFDLLHSTEKV